MIFYLWLKSYLYFKLLFLIIIIILFLDKTLFSIIMPINIFIENKISTIHHYFTGNVDNILSIYI